MNGNGPYPLGRLEPTDWVHVERYPLMAEAVAAAPLIAERTLSLPRYREFYDQQKEGACVGFSSSWMMSILNQRRYDARWLWDRAKEIDEWPDTNPGDGKGTSMRAAMDVLRAQGHCRVYRGSVKPCNAGDGILENRWATNVDGIRASIAAGTPVVLGVRWYANFAKPVKDGNEYWIGQGDLGAVRGGHAICAYKVSDRRQAIGLVNSWGKRYPLVWMPYSTVERLLSEHGEAVLVTDRP